MTRHELNTPRRPMSRRITLTEAAAILGVTREHLSRVLNGHRESKRLTHRFHALLASRKPAKP